MKYKVGEKVKAKGDWGFDESEIIEILKVDMTDHTYYCRGAKSDHWTTEKFLEPLDNPLTFQQKLDRFKSEPIGFLVKSKEIADELAKVFEREGMKGEVGSSPENIMDRCVLGGKYHGGVPWVSYNYTKGMHGLSYGNVGVSGEHLELLDITLEELVSYNVPQTLEDKLALFKAGTYALHTPTQEIYDKLMVELEKRGYVWKSGKKPTGPKEYWKMFGTFTRVRIESNKIVKGSVKLRDISNLTLTQEDFSTPQVITITSDGYHRVTAESNGVTAEALCNPTDTFDISKGSHIALKRLLEKLDEDTIEELGDLSDEPEGFHVGDIVEVAECDFSFADDIKGIQGIVIREYDRGCEVKFPVEFRDQTVWFFYDTELKLVRKYNA